MLDAERRLWGAGSWRAVARHPADGSGLLTRASSPRERRESLQQFFERAQAKELRRRVHDEGKAAGRTAVEQVGRALPSVAGPALAGSIRFSRNLALRAGARPVPPRGAAQTLPALRVAAARTSALEHRRPAGQSRDRAGRMVLSRGGGHARRHDRVLGRANLRPAAFVGA